MRSFRHWTPRYILNRLHLFLIEKRHPDWPWLTAASIQILSSWLRPTDIGFEWGSGRSTLWFARRIRKLISVEHDPKWYDKISHVLKEENVTNVSII